MTTDNKSTKDAEVENDQTKSSEVVKSGITQDEVMNDILGDDSPPAQKEESKDAEESPAADEKADEGKSDDAPDTESDDAKAKEDEEKDDKKGDDATKSEETFATVGTMKFKTKEELMDFTSSQVGYNTWLTGSLKKMRPDLFNSDGTIKSKELKEAIAQKSDKAEEAAQTIAELGEKDPEELTDEDKVDIEKARKILKPLGVVFADDPEFQAMRNTVKAQEDRDTQDANRTIREFEDKHPLMANYKNDVADIMERNDCDLEKAWKICKAVNDIVEESADEKKPDAVTKKAADSALPVAVKKQSGAMPSSGKKDFMDDLIGMTNL